MVQFWKFRITLLELRANINPALIPSRTMTDVGVAMAASLRKILNSTLLFQALWVVSKTLRVLYQCKSFYHFSSMDAALTSIWITSIAIDIRQSSDFSLLHFEDFSLCLLCFTAALQKVFLKAQFRDTCLNDQRQASKITEEHFHPVQIREV